MKSYILHKAHGIVEQTAAAWTTDEHQKWEQARQIVNALITAGLINGEVVENIPVPKAE